MKRFCLILLLFFLPLWLVAGQTPETDSLRRLLIQTQSDTSRVLLLVQLSIAYRSFKPDSSLILTRQALRLARRITYVKGEGRALSELGSILRFRGDFPQALKAYFGALQINRAGQDRLGEANTLAFIGSVYKETSAYRQALYYHQQGKKILDELSNNRTNRRHVSGVMLQLSNIGDTYEKMNRLDSALLFQQQAYALKQQLPLRSAGTLILIRLGLTLARLGNDSQALHFYQDALRETSLTGDSRIRVEAQYQLANLYYKLNQPDSSFWYVQQAYVNGKRVVFRSIMMDVSSLLAKLYKARNHPDSALYYQEIAMAAQDSLFSPEKFQRLQLLTITEQQRQQQLREDQAQAQARFQRTGLLLALATFLLVALLLWRNNRLQHRNNQILSEKNLQIEAQRNTLEITVHELKATQTQLIQKEKMASLGELTAGIAHEIQNPLNFVNNFSEVSTELVEELKKGSWQHLPDPDKKEAQTILEDLKQNLGKIHHHGKRADAIVKSMLLHSRISSGQKQPTDINALTEEYLRLSYHGLRTKDKDFNANLVTDFDRNLIKVEVVPQELGRVLLNLFNNAFYATQQKKSQLNGLYQPEVKVYTCQQDGQVEIKVRDNGSGIPESVKNKIFQPFFTTKPTGQGTGLGLSLSYDIITKGHGGRLRVNSTEGLGSEFIIQLPLP